MKHIPLRSCIVCKAQKPKSEMVRIVKTADGVVVDESGKLNGRGAYICLNAECVDNCQKKKALNKTFKTALDNKTYEAVTEKLKAMLRDDG